MNNDNWKHRSNNMNCNTCMWFVPKTPSEIKPTHFDPLGVREGDLGRCRRRCPEISGFPVVFVGDWCGDHRIDENKFRAGSQ